MAPVQGCVSPAERSESWISCGGLAASFRDAFFLSVLLVRFVMARYESAVPELEMMCATADGSAGGARERKGVGLVLQRRGGCDSRWRRGGASAVVSLCILGGLWAPLGCKVVIASPRSWLPTASEGSEGSEGWKARKAERRSRVSPALEATPASHGMPVSRSPATDRRADQAAT